MNRRRRPVCHVWYYLKTVRNAVCFFKLCAKRTRPSHISGLQTNIGFSSEYFWYFFFTDKTDWWRRRDVLRYTTYTFESDRVCKERFFFWLKRNWRGSRIIHLSVPLYNGLDPVHSVKFSKSFIYPGSTLTDTTSSSSSPLRFPCRLFAHGVHMVRGWRRVSVRCHCGHS